MATTARAWLGAAAGAALAALAGAWWYATSKPAGESSRAGVPSAIAEDRDADTGDAATEFVVDPAASGPQAAREALPRDAFSTLVVDVGAPIAGGAFDVTANALDNDVLGFFADREQTVVLYLAGDRTQRILERATRASAAGGRVELPWGDAFAGQGACVWVTHPAALARVAIVASDGSIGALPPAERVEPASIVVRHADGRPAAGAHVRQQALPPLDGEPHRATLEVRARRALVREAITDAAGRIARVPMGGPVHVSASDGGAAVARFVDGHGDVELVLGGSFSVEGIVRVQGDVGPWAMATVAAVAADGSRVPLVSGPISAASGAFGALVAPRDPSVSRYALVADHGHFVPLTHEFAPPADGSVVRLILDATAGVANWVLVQAAESQEPVAGAVVEWRWRGGRARQVTGEGGYADFAGLPREEASLHATAPGFAPFASGEMTLGDPGVPEVALVELERGAAVRGRVEFGDTPPQDFTLAFGRTGAPYLDRTTRGSAADGGAFELDDVAPGDYVIQGILDDGRPTALVPFSVAAGEEIDLRVSVPRTVRVSGKVVDGSSGAPIGGARIALVVRDARGWPIATLEDRIVSDVDGRFVVPNVPPESAGIHVATATHEPYDAPLIVLDDGSTELDLGRIVLESVHALRFRLEGVADPTAYALQWREEPATRASFDASGLVALSEGPSQAVELVHPDGTEDSYVGMAAVEGDVEPLAASDERIQLVFDDSGGSNDAWRGAPAELHFTWRDVTGNDVYRRLVTRAESIEIAGIASDRVHLTAVVGDGEHRASAVHRLGAGPIIVAFGGATLVVRVVESDGEPIAGARVSLAHFDGGAYVGDETVVSGADGTVEFVGAVGAEATLSADLADGRSVLARAVPLDAADVTELVVAPPSSLRLELRREDGAPLAGVRWRLRPVIGALVARSGVTDAAGVATIEGVDFARAHFEADVASHWPVSVLLDGGAPRREVVVHGIATLALECTDADGFAVPGATVQLRHATLRPFDRRLGELDGDVARWMSAGWLPRQALAGDHRGRLELDGMPTGEYVVEVRAGDAAVTGRVVVSASSSAPLRIVVH